MSHQRLTRNSTSQPIKLISVLSFVTWHRKSITSFPAPPVLDIFIFLSHSTSPLNHIDSGNTMSSIFKSLSQPSSRRSSIADQTIRPVNNEIFTSPEPGCGPKSPYSYTPEQEAKVSLTFTFASIAKAGMTLPDRRASQGISERSQYAGAFSPLPSFSSMHSHSCCRNPTHTTSGRNASFRIPDACRGTCGPPSGSWTTARSESRGR